MARHGPSGAGGDKDSAADKRCRSVWGSTLQGSLEIGA